MSETITTGEQERTAGRIVRRGITAALLAGMVTLGAVPSFAGPPLVTDDTGTVEPGHAEVELNGGYAYDKESDNGIATRREAFDGEMKITTGITKDLGVSLAVPYLFSERVREAGQLAGTSDGFGDMALEVKYRFFEREGLSLAVKPTILLPTGKYSAGLSDGRWGFGGALIATKEFAEGKYLLHANLGYEHHGFRTDIQRDENRSDLWSGSLAAEVQVMKGLTLMTDFGVATTRERSTSELCSYGLVGARYEVSPFLDVNAGVKVGLTKPEDDLALLYGVVLKF
ncbi:transporter [Oryzomonas sagensis]|uniref:Transporter n=1 Tax=Oryzomonas sagensis TaxID=2603857 RepID=A0ABQ6TQ67_9BACT|nr:transporter [Oryzomonas sagensis]KAB0671188.1 transporter [Oryzomonas sagensis]